MQKLLFLVSQPRSGSTLLQSLLNSHSEINTISEPWILLNELFHFTKYVDRSGFDWIEFQKSQDRLVEILPSGRSSYFQIIKSKVTNLYAEVGQSLDFDGEYFLDKTPRYYLILDQIRELFPESKIIILKRNPLNVFRSIFNTWVREDWGRFERYYHDLYSAITTINEFTAKDPLNVKEIRYEDLTHYPEKTLSDVIQFLELEREDIDLDKGYGFSKGSSDLYHGDPNLKDEKYRQSISKSTGEEYLNEKGVSNYLLFSYAKSLNKDTLSKFGYSISSELLHNVWMELLSNGINIDVEKMCKGEYNVHSLTFRARQKLLLSLL
ncbi:MAG: sulfotransferase family protein [Bacteroidota bacterium]